MTTFRPCRGCGAVFEADWFDYSDDLCDECVLALVPAEQRDEARRTLAEAREHDRGRSA